MKEPQSFRFRAAAAGRPSILPPSPSLSPALASSARRPSASAGRLAVSQGVSQLVQHVTTKAAFSFSSSDPAPSRQPSVLPSFIPSCLANPISSKGHEKAASAAAIACYQPAAVVAFEAASASTRPRQPRPAEAGMEHGRRRRCWSGKELAKSVSVGRQADCWRSGERRREREEAEVGEGVEKVPLSLLSSSAAAGRTVCSSPSSSSVEPGGSGGRLSIVSTPTVSPPHLTD